MKRLITINPELDADLIKPKKYKYYWDTRTIADAIIYKEPNYNIMDGINLEFTEQIYLNLPNPVFIKKPTDREGSR